MRGGVLGYAAQASPKIDAARTEKDPFRMENSWPTSRILPLRSGQSQPKAGCKRKGFIYGQALISATFEILKGACGRDRPISLHRPCRSGSKCSPGAHGAARNEQTGLLSKPLRRHFLKLVYSRVFSEDIVPHFSFRHCAAHWRGRASDRVRPQIYNAHRFWDSKTNLSQNKSLFEKILHYQRIEF